MSDRPPLWLSERDVTALVDLPSTIDAVEDALRLEAKGAASSMEKTYLSLGDHRDLHAVGGDLSGCGVVGTKTWTHTEHGAAPLLVLWDRDRGSLLAVMEAFALGRLRTGAMSGIATRWLAETNADRMAVLGTGSQALTQVAAVAAVRPVHHVTVWSPTAEHRTEFAAQLEREGFGFTVAVAGSPAAAIDGCAVVTTVTRATTPFLRAAMLTPGAHINGVGAISPERRELDDDVVVRCRPVVADSPSVARRLSTEMAAAGEIVALSSVIAAGQPRPPDADLTLFKAMGIGLPDVAIGWKVLTAAREAGLGSKLAETARAKPRLRRRNGSRQ